MRSISIFACTALSAQTKTAIRWKRRRLNRALFTKTNGLPWRRSPSATAHSKATTKDGKTVVISGDTAPLDIVAEKAKNCDILLHEVEYAAGIAAREPKWQKYHREVHTLSTDLAEVAKKAQPKLLVTYHRIYHMNTQDNAIDVEAETRRRSDLILQEIRDAGYTGKVVNGEDLDVFNA